jgi:hypothetical protein
MHCEGKSTYRIFTLDEAVNEVQQMKIPQAYFTHYKPSVGKA